MKRFIHKLVRPTTKRVVTSFASQAIYYTIALTLHFSPVTMGIGASITFAITYIITAII